MSTAVDTAFEDLITSQGEAEIHHGVCYVCYPGDIVPAGAVAICGYRFLVQAPVDDAAGRHKCATCLTGPNPWPCGH